MSSKTQKKLGRKVEVTTEDAIELATNMLALRCHKHVIRRELNVKFGGKGGMSARSFERIMARAREIMVASEGKSRKELRSEARRFYEAMIASEDTPAAVKVRAQEALDKLYGLPITRIIHGGTGEGGAIKTTTEVSFRNVPTDTLQEARAALQRARAAAIAVGDN